MRNQKTTSNSLKQKVTSCKDTHTNRTNDSPPAVIDWIGNTIESSPCVQGLNDPLCFRTLWRGCPVRLHPQSRNPTWGYYSLRYSSDTIGSVQPPRQKCDVAVWKAGKRFRSDESQFVVSLRKSLVEGPGDLVAHLFAVMHVLGTETWCLEPLLFGGVEFWTLVVPLIAA